MLRVCVVQKFRNGYNTIENCFVRSLLLYCQNLLCVLRLKTHRKFNFLLHVK